jgi:hypothetical protein
LSLIFVNRCTAWPCICKQPAAQFVHLSDVTLSSVCTSFFFTIEYKAFVEADVLEYISAQLCKYLTMAQSVRGREIKSNGSVAGAEGGCQGVGLGQSF